MNTFEAIEKRRSIRRFADKELPREIIDKILDAAILAPSAKNRQPWKFIVITDKEKPRMLSAMREGFENTKKGKGFLTAEELPDIAGYIAGAEYTLMSMEHAPINIFVFNTNEKFLWDDRQSPEQRLGNSADVQSVGAAIEHMLLAATDLGIGSLWICDVFFAYREVCAWLGEESQLIAAVSLGYPDESPNPRPRKKYDDVVVWR